MHTSGLVQVDHHQFVLGEPETETLDPASHGTLIEVGDGFVAFYSGIAYGPVRVQVELLDHAPTDRADDGWEVIEETTVTAAKPMVVSALDGTVSATIDPVPPGTYHVRAHARGRDRHYGLDVDQPHEDYLIRLWPTKKIDRTVRTVHKTDTAWSPQTQVDESSLSQDYVYIRDASGAVITVPPQSPQAQTVRAAMNTFGGKPLTPALEAIHSSRYVAGLDRDLIDRVEALDEHQQRAFARWCVHRAWERAGIAHIDWFRQVLDDMDAGRPPHPDFINSYAARNRLDADPRITRTIVSGLPARTELVQQYQALYAYARSMYAEATPLESAIEAFCYAAQTYGMDYPELIARARTDFFGDLPDSTAPAG
ncbi:hypothetical protein AAI421_28435 (plasmid) [Rhodococcus aetherivorans]|uniref:hypothetical protein n=1 Tax=Rhodococcus aetherivorans TaxID=191292 RepID=UPI0031D8413E